MTTEWAMLTLAAALASAAAFAILGWWLADKRARADTGERLRRMIERVREERQRRERITRSGIDINRRMAELKSASELSRSQAEEILRAAEEEWQRERR